MTAILIRAHVTLLDVAVKVEKIIVSCYCSWWEFDYEKLGSTDTMDASKADGNHMRAPICC